jgi:hypothetical protein
MSLPIITAVRQQYQLKESLLHTAQELAHRASIYGVVHDAAIPFMADKCHCSKRTFQRHVVRLVEARILKKTVTKTLVKVQVGDHYETRLRNEVNVYTFTLLWKKPSSSSAPMVKMASNLPYPQDKEKTATLEERGKGGSIQQELANHKRMLPLLYTPGTELWNRTCEEIARLEALVASA